MDSINEDLTMYLKKLIKTIETQASFSFGNIKILNQTRIDDILCCVDINFPKIIGICMKEYGNDRNLRGMGLYRELIANIKNKPPFAKTSYAVNYKEVLDIAEKLPQALADDIAYIKKTYPNLETNS